MLSIDDFCFTLLLPWSEATRCRPEFMSSVKDSLRACPLKRTLLATSDYWHGEEWTPGNSLMRWHCLNSSQTLPGLSEDFQYSFQLRSRQLHETANQRSRKTTIGLNEVMKEISLWLLEYCWFFKMFYCLNI